MSRFVKLLVVVGVVVVLLGIGGGLWWFYQNSGPKLLVRARLAMRADRTDKALELAARYISGNPRDWQGYLLQAEVYSTAARFDEARQSLAKAEELNPGEASVTLATAETFCLPARKDVASRELSNIRKAIDQYLKAEAILGKAKPSEPKGILDVRQRQGVVQAELGHAHDKLAGRLVAEAVGLDARRSAAEWQKLRADAQRGDKTARGILEKEGDPDAWRAAGQAASDDAQKLRQAATQTLLAVVTKDPSRPEAASALVQLCLDQKDAQTLGLARQAIMGSADPPPAAATLLIVEELQAAGRQGGPAPLNRDRVAAACKALGQIGQKHPENAQVKLTHAGLAVSLGDTQTAQRLCDEVLKVDARNPRARLIAAELLAGRGDLAEAQNKLLALTKDFPGWSEAQFAYARVALRLGKTSAARDAVAALAKIDSPQSPTKLMQAELALALGDLSTAKGLAEEVLAAQRGTGGPNPAAWLVHGTALAQAGDLDKAELELAALKKACPRWPEAAIAYAQVAVQRGNAAGALAAAQEAVNLDPTNEQARRLLTQLQLYEGQDKTAFESAQQAYQAHADDPAALGLLVQAAIRTQQIDLARKALDKAVADNPAKPVMLMAAAEGYAGLNDSASALKTAKLAADCKPATARDKVAVSRALVQLDRVPEAEKLIQEELQKDPKQAGLRFELGRICAASGRALQAIDQYRAAADLQKDNVEFRLTLARALLDSGDIRECRKVLDSIDSSEPNANALRLQVKVIQGDLGGIEPMLRNQQAAGRSALAKALPFLAQGQLKQCVDVCEAELKTNPGDTELRLLLGRAYLLMGQQEKGLQQWEKVLQTAPERLSTYLELASILTRDTAADKVAGRLAGIPGARRDMVDMAVGYMLAGSGEYDKAIPMLSNLANQAQVPEQVRGRASMVLANALAQTGQVDKAVAECDRLAALAAWRTQAIFSKAQILAQAGRIAPAETALAETRKLAEAQKDTALLRNVAELYAKMGKTDDALAVCDLVQQILPDDARSFLLRAAVLGQAQRPAEAIGCYRKAIELQPGNFQFYTILAQALEVDGKPVEALETLRKLEDLGPAAASVATFQRGLLFVAWGLQDQAAECFTKLSNLGYGSSPQVQLALGRSFAGLGQASRAAEFLAAISASAPEYLPARLLLAQLAPTPEAKLAGVRQISQGRPGHPELLLQEMRMLVGMNKLAEAVKVFQTFADQYAKGKPLPEEPAFLAILSALGTTDKSAKSGRAGAAAIAARVAKETNLPRWRNLAILLAMDDDPQAATALLPEPDKADPASALLGFCLAQQRKDAAAQAKWHDRFVQAAGPLAKRNPSQVAADRLLLDLAQGQAEPARAELAGIAGILGYGRSPATELLRPPSAAAAGEALGLRKASVALNMGLPAVARAWAKDVLAARPTCQWAAALALRADPAAEPQQEILALLQPKNCPVAQLAAAEGLTRARQVEEAAKLYGQVALADPSPEIILNQANCLEAAGKLKEALDLYKQVWEAAKNPAAANNAAYLIVKLHPQDAAQLAQAQALAEQALAAQPNSPYYRDTLGWIAYLQGRHEPACASLRQAVRGLPGSPEMHYHLGMAEAACGRLDMARWHYTACVNLYKAMQAQGAAMGPELAQVASLSAQALDALGPPK